MIYYKLISIKLRPYPSGILHSVILCPSGHTIALVVSKCRILPLKMSWIQ